VCDRREQLWLVTLGDRPDEAPTVRELTDLPHDVGAPAWHPDGTHVVAITRAEGLDPGEPYDQLVTVEVASGEVRRGPIGSWEAVAVAPDGTLHVAGLTDPFDWPGVHGVYRVAAGHDPAGPLPDADLVDLTGHLDRDTVAVRAKVVMKPGDVAAMPANIRHQGYAPKRSMLLVWENASPDLPGLISSGRLPINPVDF
jgi:hypothetical protein